LAVSGTVTETPTLSLEPYEVRVTTSIISTLPADAFSYSSFTLHSTGTATSFPQETFNASKVHSLAIGSIVAIVVVLVVWLLCNIGGAVIIFLMCRRSKKSVRKWHEPGVPLAQGQSYAPETQQGANHSYAGNTNVAYPQSHPYVPN